MGNFLLTFLILSVLLFVVGFAPFGNKSLAQSNFAKYIKLKLPPIPPKTAKIGESACAVLRYKKPLCADIIAVHVPVFFVLSGYLYKEKPVKKVFKSGNVNLLLPYLATLLIVVIITRFLTEVVTMNYSIDTQTTATTTSTTTM